jgi:FkbM family methyltransferase
VVQIVNGIYLPDGDMHFAAALKVAPLVDGKATYQLHKLNAALRYVKYKGVAVDVGAHVGLWARVLAKHFLLVHAFEPLPEHVECLEANCSDLKNVVVHNGFLLGNRDEAVAFLRTNDNSGNCHVFPGARPVLGSGATDVFPMRRLDDFDIKTNFLKIDVEGYEYEVVLGAEKVIRSSKPVMVVEQKPGNAERYGVRTGEVLDLLKGWGARIVWQRAGDFCLIWE